jgi:acyl-coenzyme A synthetase/AMP-(fatty) acid ligase
MVSHGAALAFVEWAVTTFHVVAEDVLSNHAPLHFDLSTFDLFAAAAAGAHLVVLNDETVRFPIRSADVLERYGISVWYSVPGALRRMMTSGRLADRNLSALRLVLFAGEAYPAEDLRCLQAVTGPRVRLANLYGPTETNVCTYWDVPPAGTWSGDQIPIGVDCASCEGIVVDDDLRPGPDGTRGELLVRGGSLMIGYWGDAERTAQSFVHDFCYPHLGDHFYRTGDIVSRDASGVYAFHGRRDSMVKVRGYRVELGEIEAALSKAADVRDAAVVAVQEPEGSRDGDVRLIAFLTPADPGSCASDTSRRVHAALTSVLPKYMLPADYRWLPRLPATSSGKVDRLALLRLATGDSSSDTIESSSHRGAHGCD